MCGIGPADMIAISVVSAVFLSPLAALLEKLSSFIFSSKALKPAILL
jgi:hypothetical protein